MSKEANLAKKEYMKKYREENRSKIREQQRIWRQNNPDKVKEYQEKYWSKKAETNLVELGV